LRCTITTDVCCVKYFLLDISHLELSALTEKEVD
jgi:hypothetical protein